MAPGNFPSAISLSIREPGLLCEGSLDGILWSFKSREEF